MTLLRTFGMLALVLLPAYAAAQGILATESGQTAQIPVQFDFLNPGARSLGLGGAFVAVADDATAALTNPAGLTLLARPEVSAELRFRNLDTTYLNGGRLSGTVTQNNVDTIAGPLYSVSGDFAARLNFLSVVYPVQRWSFSGYRHELVRQENSFTSEGAFYAIPLTGGGSINDARQQGLSGERTVRIVNYGLATGYRLHDRFSLGVGVSFYRFDLESNFGALAFQNGIFSPVDPSSRGSSSVTTQAGETWQVAVNAGLLATLTNSLKAGFTFRQGTSFDYEQVNTFTNSPTSTQIGRFQTPTVIGGGVRLQPAAQWSFAIDYSYVQYSRLITDFIDYQLNPAVVDRISLSDAHELHFGGEYSLVGVRFTPSLRGGVWYDPEHSLSYSSDGSGSAADVQLQAVLNRGEGRVHFSTGLGLALSRSFEFNAAGDFTKDRLYVSASMVARFGN